jgi:GH15 family glucan-1,4-alpha-glucosidase
VTLPIEDYALIGDCHTGALVGTNGSIDWLCLPRFDSASTFGALLGDEEHGHWSLAPLDATAATTSTTREYLRDTFVLVTHWETSTGAVQVLDFMPRGDHRADVVRRVRGIRGSVTMLQTVRVRFDYADAMPWIRQAGTDQKPAIVAVAGPDAVILRTPQLQAVGHAHIGEFVVGEGDVIDSVLTWFPAHKESPTAINVDHQLSRTTGWWQEWASRIDAVGPYEAHVRRSLLVLRALTHEDTGGIVAAATTSLPEDFGGTRNWDYRYVWLRDAALTIEALILHGFEKEAGKWRGWLLRAIAGDPADLQIMYGLSGERRLDERELTSLPGYNGSSPVRVGNGAYTQYQGDIFGEVMIALDAARTVGLADNEFSRSLQLVLLDYAEKNWNRPDNGIWEIRGPKRHFTHSRVMLWAAFDRGIHSAENHGLVGPVDEWRKRREMLRAEIERRGWNAELGTYTQYYDGTSVDASLLQLSQVGFVAAADPRMLGTVAAIERDLLHNGLLMRYRTETGVDGLDGGEHPFLACSFWLVEQYAHSGRIADATALMDTLLSFSNDVGLLSEEYDVVNKRHAGNTPQALSHLALVRAADSLAVAHAAETAGTAGTAGASGTARD